MKLKLALVSSVACNILIVPTALAQEDAEDSNRRLDTVTVTAEKVESSAQDVAASLAVVDATSLERLAQITADDALRNVTGVEVQGAARGATVAVRGIGSDLPPGAGESSVSTNFDGVYSIRAEAAMLGFYDLDRIEVLRGPQGTLYGRNATAGVVNVISADPVIGETGGRFTVGAGSDSLYHGDAAFNFSLSDTVAVRGAIAAIQRDGYLSNGQDDADHYGGRLKLLVEPNDDFRLLLGTEFTHLGGLSQGAVPTANFLAGNPYEATDPTFEGQDYDGYKVYAKVDVGIGPGILTFIPAYQDGSGTLRGFFGGRGTFGEDPKIIEQTSAELRYASRPESDIQWVVGAYYYDYEQGNTSRDLTQDPVTGGFVIGANEGFNTNTGESTAFFGQLTVPLTDQFRLTGGVRQTEDERTAESLFFPPPPPPGAPPPPPGAPPPPPPAPVGGVVTGDFTDWKIGAEWDLSDDSLLYATVATGFRPGGFNSFNSTNFGPEELISYEVGSKNVFADGAMQFNATAFYYDYQDYQVVNFFIGPTGPNLVFLNADATNWGIEADFLGNLTDNDTVNVSVAYLDSEITSDLLLNPVDPFTPENFRGERLPHSPEWTIKGGYEHVFNLANGSTLTPRIDVRYVSEQFVAPNNSPGATQDAYTTGDLSLTWSSAEDDGFSVTGYVKNFADEAVLRSFFVGFVQVSPPQTYGVTVSKKF